MERLCLLFRCVNCNKESFKECRKQQIFHMLYGGFLFYIYCCWGSIWYFHINMFRSEIRFYALLFEEILALKMSTFLFSVSTFVDVTSLNGNCRF